MPRSAGGTAFSAVVGTVGMAIEIIAAICGQSVCSNEGACACTAAMAACS
ncbi:MAG TPA: hypothetical protein VGS06_02570 [Streptosporangiaceae bacterium]|nr:hypothetical protein [Streptosporangiaceae bacterium]